jgi:hypothetical protein
MKNPTAAEPFPPFVDVLPHAESGVVIGFLVEPFCAASCRVSRCFTGSKFSIMCFSSLGGGDCASLLLSSNVVDPAVAIPTSKVVVDFNYSDANSLANRPMVSSRCSMKPCSFSLHSFDPAVSFFYGGCTPSTVDWFTSTSTSTSMWTSTL